MGLVTLSGAKGFQNGATQGLWDASEAGAEAHKTMLEYVRDVVELLTMTENVYKFSLNTVYGCITKELMLCVFKSTYPDGYYVDISKYATWEGRTAVSFRATQSNASSNRFFLFFL